jgi:hypothetical protein
MSTDFRATQMQAAKYIRFISTQALRTRAMSAKRRHYRIIARARARDRSLASALAQGAWPNLSANSWTRDAHARRSAHVHVESRSALVFLVSPRLKTACARARRRTRGTSLKPRPTVREASVWTLRAYQIETPRMLVAIEFFFTAIITFLSSGRCKRAPRRSKRDANQVIRASDSAWSQTPRRFFSASLTACGLALPPVDFIT